MKRYFLHSILVGLVCMNFISTPIQGMEITRIKHALNVPTQFISNNVYPLTCIGAACFVGGCIARTLFNYWKDRERTYEIDGITKVVINKWPYVAPHEYIAVIKNKKTNESYGHLIYRLQAAGVAYLRILSIEEAYREKRYGSKLLQAILGKLPSLHNCSKVTVNAIPIELRSGETIQQMLPKLIRFYQKHGAKITQMGNNGAWMEFDLQEATQNK